jgi:hypothetical protein
MRRTSVLSVLVGFMFAGAAATAEAKTGCERAAATVAVSKFKSYFYRGRKRIRVVDLVDCQRRRSRKGGKYQRCEVEASTGDGAGDLSLIVMMNGACTKSYAAFIVGME